MKIKGSIWKTGTKDGAYVYFELWNGDDTQKVVDGDLTPQQAYNIGKSMVGNALKLGYEPDSEER
ncbi:hypothetical protein [Mycobacteroides salmoniphilum]|uniref:Uncharacterized protein n=1 Tax=Mycobacteroides salmoniphilum TaxID=404941 RepID=A0A4V3HZC8_9MYCO|nr:hypothetical protein [Mycobacteroides salmoniphilum]TDZ92107.1 hypothetical protein CCUG60885_04221 [Mycobacteroides salmoniphilum]TEA07337.1 hypothetical protein CCUG60883_01370 [Mycobacteroides salmoniphilum]